MNTAASCRQHRLKIALAMALIASGFSFAQPASPKDPEPAGVPIALPGGLVIVIGGSPKLPSSSKPVVLSGEEYQQLLDRIKRLQAIVDAQQTIRPRSCELEGRVEKRGRRSVVRLRTTFKVTTTKPSTIIHLGCQRAQAAEVRDDDGKTPLLTAADDGLRVLVEKEGDHTFRLELDVPLTPRGPKGAELGFDIGLPGAPITALTFEPPTGVRRYTLATRTSRSGIGVVAEPEIEHPDADRFRPGKGGAPLGPITNLALSWEDPDRKSDPLRSAEADINVVVGANEIVSEARIHLRGPSSEWKFTAPATADVTVGIWSKPGSGKAPEFSPDRAPNVLRPEPGQTIWRVVFPESPTTDLLVNVIARQPRPGLDEPGAQGPFTIGPFAVLDATSQTGVIRIRTPSGWQSQATLKGNTQRVLDDNSTEAAYHYKYSELKSPPVPPLLLTLSPVAGVVYSRTRHEARLTEFGWKLKSEIAAAPNRTEVEYLDLEIPAGFRPSKAEPPEIVEELSVVRDEGPGKQVVRARLTSPRRSSFSFTLEGDYSLPAGKTSTSLALPRLLGVSERSAEFIAIGPSRFDLRGSVRTWNSGKVGSWATPLTPEPAENGVRIRATLDKPVAVADLTWRASPWEAKVRSDIDVEFTRSRIRINQRLRFQFRGQLPERVRLHASRPLLGVRSAGSTIEPAGSDYYLLIPESGGLEQEFVIAFSTAHENSDEPFDIPMMTPAAGDLMQTVRIWAPRGHSVHLADPTDWTEAPIERVDGHDEFPDLVVRTRGRTDSPRLVIRQTKTGVEPATSITAARIEVDLGENDAIYRSKFWIRDWLQPIECEFPTQTKGHEVFIAGKRVDVVLTNHSPEQRPRIMLQPPSGLSGVVVLEVRYLGPNRRLEPPTLGRCELLAGVTWLVASRPGSIVLVPGEAVGAWSSGALLSTLGIRSGLVTQSYPDGSAEQRFQRVVIRQRQPGSMSVVQVPRSLWLLGWSVGLFCFSCGLMWAGVRLRRVAVLFTLALFVAAAFALPQPAAEGAFAAIPGLVAFLTLAIIYHRMRIRHHRRIGRPSGFARTGSSLVRPSAKKPQDITTRELSAPASSSS